MHTSPSFSFFPSDKARTCEGANPRTCEGANPGAGAVSNTSTEGKGDIIQDIMEGVMNAINYHCQSVIGSLSTWSLVTC